MRILPFLLSLIAVFRAIRERCLCRRIFAISGTSAGSAASVSDTAVANIASVSGESWPAGGPTYTFQCNLEGDTGSSTDGDPTNGCGWTVTDSTTWDDDYTSEPLDGSESLLIVGASGYKTLTTDDGDWWFAAKWQLDIHNGTADCMYFADSGGVNIGRLEVRAYITDQYFRLYYNDEGSYVSDSGDNLVEGTSYYVKVHYNNGSGSDGVWHVYYSSDGTSWTTSITVTDATDTDQIARFGVDTTGTTTQYLYDLFRVDDEDIDY